MMFKRLLVLVVFFTNGVPSDSKNAIEENSVTHEYPEKLDYDLIYLDKGFVAFKEALAFKESQGNYKAVNTLGYLGKYQFGRSTLKRFGIYDTQTFLNSPELQEKAFEALCKVNKWILRKDIQRYVGKTIKGIKITESGILAAAHLSGAGNVKKFLRSNGNYLFSDAYGSCLTSYLNKFSGYDLSTLRADRLASV